VAPRRGILHHKHRCTPARPYSHPTPLPTRVKVKVKVKLFFCVSWVLREQNIEVPQDCRMKKSLDKITHPCNFSVLYCEWIELVRLGTGDKQRVRLGKLDKSKRDKTMIH
jgi:hypothetical protein